MHGKMWEVFTGRFTGLVTSVSSLGHLDTERPIVPRTDHADIMEPSIQRRDGDNQILSSLIRTDREGFRAAWAMTLPRGMRNAEAKASASRSASRP